jgi:hypothetical protein
MQVNVLSEKQQSFNGAVYWLCGHYFQRYGRRLHIAVWEYHHGPVQKGFAVHHIDNDKGNNQVENLALIERGAHTSHHQKGHSRPFSELSRSRAAEWHGSEAGREWHKKHQRDDCAAMHHMGDYVCACCGKSFVAQDMGRNRFCSNNCKSMWRRRSGIDDIEKRCVVCGGPYLANKYATVKTCGRPCGHILRERRKRGEE